MAGEVSPEDLAEQIKALVDKNTIKIPFETPPPPTANKLSDGRAVKWELDSSDAVFAKPNGKRAAASAEPAKSKGRVAKNAKSAGKVSGLPGQTQASAGRNSQKKRKQSPSDEGDLQEPFPKSAKGGGPVGSSAKVLHGALTPVGSDGAAVKTETGGEEGEENSAWDALLSVCARMPRQKTKS